MGQKFPNWSKNYLLMRIINLTKYLAPAGLAKMLWKEFVKSEKIAGAGELNLVFAGERRIRTLNKKYRGKDKTTDVLSFGEFDGREPVEIIVCLFQARKQAERLGHSLEKEIGRLFLHGILHAAGYDHEKGKTAAEKIRKKEKEILRKLGLEAIY